MPTHQIWWQSYCTQHLAQNSRCTHIKPPCTKQHMHTHAFIHSDNKSIGRRKATSCISYMITIWPCLVEHRSYNGTLPSISPSTTMMEEDFIKLFRLTAHGYLSNGQWIPPPQSVDVEGPHAESRKQCSHFFARFREVRMLLQPASLWIHVPAGVTYTSSTSTALSGVHILQQRKRRRLNSRHMKGQAESQCHSSVFWSGGVTITCMPAFASRLGSSCGSLPVVCMWLVVRGALPEKPMLQQTGHSNAEPKKGWLSRKSQTEIETFPPCDRCQMP